MKLIGVILSVLFLSLSFVPCADEANSFEKEQHVIESHGNHDSQADLCSPFCQCHCCHNHIMVYKLPILGNVSAVVTTSNFTYTSMQASGFLDRFIPPPKY